VKTVSPGNLTPLGVAFVVSVLAGNTKTTQDNLPVTIVRQANIGGTMMAIVQHVLLANMQDKDNGHAPTAQLGGAMLTAQPALNKLHAIQ
jgi:hypothetical protein